MGLPLVISSYHRFLRALDRHSFIHQKTIRIILLTKRCTNVQLGRTQQSTVMTSADTSSKENVENIYESVKN
jgi:hypothetical protein